MEDNISKIQFHFNFEQCGNKCVRDLRGYVYGSLLMYPFNKITSNGQDEKKEGSLTFDLANNIIKINNTGEQEKELRAKSMTINEEQNYVQLGGYIGKDKFIRYNYQYNEGKMPASLVSHLSYVSKKVKKQLPMGCTNSIFHFWRRLNSVRRNLFGKFDSVLPNNISTHSSSLDFEEGTLEFTDEGKIKINDAEFYYFYYFVFETNEKSDQAIVELYYSDINVNNPEDQIDFYQKMKRFDLYFSLVDRCKEEFRNALRNKTTCIPIIGGIEFANTLTGVSKVEKKIKINKDMKMADISSIGGLKFIKSPFIKDNTNTIQIETMEKNETKLEKIYIEKEEFQINFSKNHPCSIFLKEIIEKQETMGLKPLEPKPVLQPKPELKSTINYCKDSKQENKYFFKFRRAQPQYKYGKITSVLNGKRFKYVYDKKETEETIEYNQITIPKNKNCFIGYCRVMFDEITFEFEFGCEECFELFKRAFGDHIFTQKNFYQNYYFNEELTKKPGKPMYITNSKEKTTSQLSLSNFNIEEIGLKLKPYNKLDINFFKDGNSVMIEYFIRNKKGYLISRYWFQFEDNKDKDIEELEKYVNGSSIVFNYYEKDNQIVNRQIKFSVKENLAHIYESNTEKTVEVKFIHFDDKSLYIKGYYNTKLFGSNFKAETKLSDGLKKQLQYVKAKMSKVETDVNNCETSKFSYWGVYHPPNDNKNIQYTLNQSTPNYENKLVSLEKGIIEFNNGIIKTTKYGNINNNNNNNNNNNSYFYYHFDLKTSAESSYNLSAQITYSDINDASAVKLLQTEFHFTLSITCRKELMQILQQQATCDTVGNYFFGKSGDMISIDTKMKQIGYYINNDFNSLIMSAFYPIVIDEINNNTLNYKGKSNNDSNSILGRDFKLNNILEGHPCHIKLNNLIKDISTAKINTDTKHEEERLLKPEILSKPGITSHNEPYGQPEIQAAAKTSKVVSTMQQETLNPENSQVENRNNGPSKKLLKHR
jgi:hypothetical protein